MADRITVFTITTPSFRQSSELALCLDAFRRALPKDICLIVGEGQSPHALSGLILEHLAKIATPYVLIVKEPALLMKEGTVETMREVMSRDPRVLCVLPSDIRGYRSSRSAAYYTLRGFEKFVDSLPAHEQRDMEYDGREPLMLLIRSDLLSQMKIPEDPLSIPKELPAGSVRISLTSYIHPFISYYEEVRSDVLPLVPEGIESLLDIGCSRGNFGAAVRKARGCRVVGIEKNRYEAQRAKMQLDLVIEEDILSADIGEKFDCITCLDVLEHAEDTAAFLEKVKSLLTPSGSLLLSVPNIGHWSIVEDLIAGRWDYVPAGILCISHLRFFTKKTIEDALTGAELTVVRIQENVSPMQKEQTDLFALLEQAGTEVDRQSLSCLGYYIVARKTFQN